MTTTTPNSRAITGSSGIAAQPTAAERRFSSCVSEAKMDPPVDRNALMQRLDTVEAKIEQHKKYLNSKDIPVPYFSELRCGLPSKPENMTDNQLNFHVERREKYDKDLVELLKNSPRRITTPEVYRGTPQD